MGSLSLLYGIPSASSASRSVAVGLGAGAQPASCTSGITACTAAMHMVCASALYKNALDGEPSHALSTSCSTLSSRATKRYLILPVSMPFTVRCGSQFFHSVMKRSITSPPSRVSWLTPMNSSISNHGSTSIFSVVNAVMLSSLEMFKNTVQYWRA